MQGHKMSGVPQWALVAGVKGIIHDAEKDGKVEGLVKTTNEAITAFFPGQEKSIKFMLVDHIIFPFVKLFLKDDPDGLAKAKARL